MNADSDGNNCKGECENASTHDNPIIDMFTHLGVESACTAAMNTQRSGSGCEDVNFEDCLATGENCEEELSGVRKLKDLQSKVLPFCLLIAY